MLALNRRWLSIHFITCFPDDVFSIENSFPLLEDPEEDLSVHLPKYEEVDPPEDDSESFRPDDFEDGVIAKGHEDLVEVSGNGPLEEAAEEDGAPEVEVEIELGCEEREERE